MLHVSMFSNVSRFPVKESFESSCDFWKLKLVQLVTCSCRDIFFALSQSDSHSTLLSTERQRENITKIHQWKLPVKLGLFVDVRDIARVIRVVAKEFAQWKSESSEWNVDGIFMLRILREITKMNDDGIQWKIITKIKYLTIKQKIVISEFSSYLDTFVLFDVIEMWTLNSQNDGNSCFNWISGSFRDRKNSEFSHFLAFPCKFRSDADPICCRFPSSLADGRLIRYPNDPQSIHSWDPANPSTHRRESLHFPLQRRLRIDFSSNLAQFQLFFSPRNPKHSNNRAKQMKSLENPFPLSIPFECEFRLCRLKNMNKKLFHVFVKFKFLLVITKKFSIFTTFSHFSFISQFWVNFNTRQISSFCFTDKCVNLTSTCFKSSPKILETCESSWNLVIWWIHVNSNFGQSSNFAYGKENVKFIDDYFWTKFPPYLKNCWMAQFPPYKNRKFTNKITQFFPFLFPWLSFSFTWEISSKLN